MKFNDVVVFRANELALPGHAHFSIEESRGEVSIFIRDTDAGGSFRNDPAALSEILTRIYHDKLRGVDAYDITAYLDCGEEVFEIPFKRPFYFEVIEAFLFVFGWLVRFRVGDPECLYRSLGRKKGGNA